MTRCSPVVIGQREVYLLFINVFSESKNSRSKTTNSRKDFSVDDQYIRDHVGAFIQTTKLRRAGEISVFKAEACGVLEVLKWINELHLSNVDIECDSLLTVDAINGGKENYLEVGSVL